MPFGEIRVRHGAVQPHVGDRVSLAFGDGAARPLARLGVVRAGGVFPPMAGGACLRAVRPRVARVRASGFVLAIPRILARPLGRAFLADAGKPGVVRLVVGALLRGLRGMLARAGGCLLKPLKVVAGGFLRPGLTIPRRLVGGGAGVTGRAWSCCDLARLVILRVVVPRRLGGRRRVVVSPEKIGTVQHGECLSADAGLPLVALRLLLR